MGTNVAMGITVVGTVGVAYWLFGDDDCSTSPGASPSR